VDVKLVQPAVPAAATKTVSYEIQPKDTLGKIARKFYGESKESDIKKIIAANPGTLKDATSVLVAGKKLSIPGIAVAPPKTDVKPMAKVTIAPPGAAPAKGTADPRGKIEQPKKDAAKEPKIYVVQAGDTLEKIAHKIAPSKSSEMVQKLMAANGMKDADSLQAGAKLKLPA